MLSTFITGEFGIVYKAELVGLHGNQLPQTVAVKTVKGTAMKCIEKRKPLLIGRKLMKDSWEMLHEMHACTHIF